MNFSNDSGRLARVSVNYNLLLRARNRQGLIPYITDITEKYIGSLSSVSGLCGLLGGFGGVFSGCGKVVECNKLSFSRVHNLLWQQRSIQMVALPTSDNDKEEREESQETVG